MSLLNCLVEYPSSGIELLLEIMRGYSCVAFYLNKLGFSERAS
jgi:hypothetical protein